MTEGKDVYAAMAPATYTRTLGSGVGRSPTTIVARKPPVALSAAMRRIRRRRRVDGSKAAQMPGHEGSVGPFPGQYGRAHAYARDVHSGAGNCVCGRAPGHRLHPGVKALSDGIARLESKTDPEVLEIFRGARVESKVRHVRTAAGVARYHAPIGTPIVGGHAVPSLPSAGGGRVRAGGNAKRSTSRLIGSRGSPSRGGGSVGRRIGRSLTGRGGFTGSGSGGRGRGNAFTGRRGRGGIPGRRGRGLPGNGNGFNGGAGGLGGFGGAGLGGMLGELIGAGGKQPAAKKPPKQKKPKKAKAPPKAKKAKTGKNTGSGSGTGKGSSTAPKTPTTTPTPSQGELDQAAQELLLIPPDRLGGVLHSLPYDVLGDLLSTIQDPQFRARAGNGPNTGVAAAGATAGAKALRFGADRMEAKAPQRAHGDERCMACGVDLDDYDTVPSGKGFELVVCVPCAAESKAGGSGIPGHLPAQLRKYWTTGKGKARWAASPTPYRTLAAALRSEGVPERVIGGLTAELFRDVFGIWPANRPRALGGSTHGHAR